MPWTAYIDGRDITGTRCQPDVRDETGRVIAVIRESKAIYTADGDLDEAAMAAAEDRTARLMAASEQMYEALKLVADSVWGSHAQAMHAVGVAKAAIRAAEGGGE